MNLILPRGFDPKRMISLPSGFDPDGGLKFVSCFGQAQRMVARYRANSPRGFDPVCGRQLFNDGPYIDPPVANLTTLTATTIEDLWTAATYTPIFANDPKAGKIYCVRAGGTISLTGGTAIITPQLATSSTALGVSLTVGTVTVAIAAWYLAFDLVIRTVGSAGTCIGTGYMVFNGGVVSGTANPNMIVFGGTSAAINTTVNDGIQIRKTLSATNSVIPQFVYIFSRN
jgi:hypothetical protein